MYTNNEEIIEKLDKLAVGQLELLSMQRLFMEAMVRLVAGQEELLLLLKETGAGVADLVAGAEVPGLVPEEWITKKTAMEEVLFVSERTFYRDYDLHRWPRKKLGKRWYYLKSAMLTGS